MVDENEKVNNVCKGRLARDECGGFFLHGFALDAHEHLPDVLDEAFGNLGGVEAFIVALEAVGIGRGAFAHDLDGSSPVAQLKHITLPQF